MIDANGFPQSLLVLGGGSEIGIEIAKALTNRRLERVTLSGPRPATLALARAALEGLAGLTVDEVHLDFDEVETLDARLQQIFSDHHGYDSVLVAGGILGDQERDERSPEEVARVLTTNFVGPAVLLTTTANLMRTQGYGLIVVLSSVAGEVVRRSNYVYGSSKHGLDGFAQGTAEALRPFGIRLLIVRPGFVTTKMTAGIERAPLSTDASAVADDVIKGIESAKAVIWSPRLMRLVMAIYRHLPMVIRRRLPL